MAGITDSGCVAEIPAGPIGSFIAVSDTGELCWVMAHDPAVITNNVGPFTWDTATQMGNVPPSPILTNPDDGTFTYAPQDGSAAVLVDICDKLQYCTIGNLGNVDPDADNAAMGDVLTFDGTEWTTGAGHPPMAVTTSDAPFAFDAPTQVLNIPIPATLTNPANTAELVFTRGDGSAPVTLDICDLIVNCSVDVLNDVDTTTDPPAVGEVLTWDGTNWVPGAGSHPPLTVTSANAPLTFIEATQSLQLPFPSSLFNIGGTSVLSWIRGDGSPQVDFDICQLITFCSVDALNDVDTTTTPRLSMKCLFGTVLTGSLATSAP